MLRRNAKPLLLLVALVLMAWLFHVERQMYAAHAELIQVGLDKARDLRDDPLSRVSEVLSVRAYPSRRWLVAGELYGQIAVYLRAGTEHGEYTYYYVKRNRKWRLLESGYCKHLGMYERLGWPSCKEPKTGGTPPSPKTDEGQGATDSGTGNRGRPRRVRKRSDRPQVARCQPSCVMLVFGVRQPAQALWRTYPTGTPRGGLAEGTRR